jgi:hypothetical protein
MSDDVSGSGKAGSILTGLNICNLDDWRTFARRLEALVLSGGLRNIPPPEGQPPSCGDHWYLEEGTGDFYFYREPGERNFAEWTKADPFEKREEFQATLWHGGNILQLDIGDIPVGQMDRGKALSLLTRLFMLIGVGKIEVVDSPFPAAPGESTETWFRDPRSGIVYKLVEGDGEDDSFWGPVPPHDLHMKAQ